MIEDLLKRQKINILEKWFDLILETFSSDTASVLRKDRDPFTNPVGYTISRGLEVLLRKICEGVEDDEYQQALNSILKIRSVQEVSPSKAVEFIFFLKKAIEEILGNKIFEESLIKQWLCFQSRIDKMALQAFNHYMDCREKICEIRVNQAMVERDMAFRMMERMIQRKDV
jgi:hypothetical protein